MAWEHLVMICMVGLPVSMVIAVNIIAYRKQKEKEADDRRVYTKVGGRYYLGGAGNKSRRRTGDGGSGKTKGGDGG